MRVADVRKKNILILLSLLFLLLFFLFAWRQGEILVENLNTRIFNLLSESIEGEVEWERVSLFPFNRIIFHELKIIGEGEIPVLTIERMVVRYNPLYLFVEGIGIIGGISHIQILSPTLYIKEREGVFNIGDFTGTDGLLPILETQFSMKEGTIALDSHSYGSLSITDVMVFMDISSHRGIDLHAQGEISLGEERASLSLYGEVEERDSHLHLNIQGLPLSLQEVPFLTGEGMTDIRVSYKGSLTRGDVQGEVLVREGGFYVQDMEFKETEGRLFFSREDLHLEPLFYGEIDSLFSLTQLQDLLFHLQVTGEVLHQGKTEYRLTAHLEDEELSLSFSGTDLPLSKLPIVIPELDLDLGFTDVNLNVRGEREALSVEGDLLLKEASAYDRQRDLRGERIGGTLSFVQRDLFLKEIYPFSFETLSSPSLKGNIEGLVEGLPLSVEGSLHEDGSLISIASDTLSLSLLSPLLEEDWEIIDGVVGGEITLEGTPSSFLVEGSLEVDDAIVYYRPYDDTLLKGKGDIKFKYNNLSGLMDYTEELSIPDLSLEDLYLKGHLAGEIGESNYLLEIGFDEEILSLSLQGEMVQLEELPFITLEDVEDLSLLSHLQLHLHGQVEDLALSLEVQLLEGGFYYPKEDLLFSSLQGDITLSLEEQGFLYSRDLLALSFEEVHARGSVRGDVKKEEHSSSISLQGQLEKGAIDLHITGEELPLTLLTQYIEIPQLEDLWGLSRVDLFIIGDREEFNLSCEVQLIEAQLTYRPEDLHLSMISGPLFIELERPLILEEGLGDMGFEDLRISTSLVGQLHEGERSSPISLEGFFHRDDFHLSLGGERVPLLLISQRIDLPLEVLSGLFKGEIYLEGDHREFFLSGEVEIQEAHLYDGEEDFSLSHIEGLFTFSLERPLTPSFDSSHLSLEDLYLRGELKGILENREKEDSPLYLSLFLHRGLMDLSFLGEDLPLTLLSERLDLFEGEILQGRGDLKLLLSGEALHPAIKGELLFSKGEVVLFSPDLSLGDIEGEISFSSLSPSLSLDTLELEGKVVSSLVRKGEETPLLLEGGLFEGLLHLSVKGERTPLSLFSEELASFGFTSLEGSGAIEVFITGSPDAISVKGDILFEDLGLLYVEEDLSLSSLEGRLSFSIEEPIAFDSPSFHLEDLDLEGTLKGAYTLSGEGGTLAIEGYLAEGLYELIAKGENLPLEHLSLVSLPLEIEDLRGESDVVVEIEGSQEEMILSGTLLFKEVGFYYQEEDLILSSITGDLAFTFKEPLYFHEPLALSIDSLDLEGTLKGAYTLSGEGGTLGIEGYLAEGLYELVVRGEGLPLEHLSLFSLPLEIEDLRGESDVVVEIEGSLEEMILSGTLLFKEGGFYYGEEDLILSSITGDLTFGFKEPLYFHEPLALSIDSLDLEGTLKGAYTLSGEGGTLGIEGYLAEGLYELVVRGEGLPLEHLSLVSLPLEIEDLRGESDMVLEIEGFQEEMILSGTLLFKEGGFYYQEEDLILSSITGDLAFGFKEPLYFHEPLALSIDSLDLEGRLKGAYTLSGEGGTLAIEGYLEEGLYELLVRGEGLPLEHLSLVSLPLEIEDLRGESDVVVEIEGSQEEMILSGTLLFKEGGFYYKEEDLILSSITGDLAFALEDPIVLQSLSLPLNRLDLRGSLKGEYMLLHEGGVFLLEGQLERGLYSLTLLSEDVPLHHLQLDGRVEDIDSLHGYGRLHLTLEGSQESLKGSLSIDLSQIEGLIPSLELSFLEVGGDLSMTLLEPLSFPLEAPSLRDLNITGDLTGLYQLQDEEGLFRLKGDMIEEEISLALKGYQLPLHHLPLAIPTSVEDLQGYVSLDLWAHGTIESLHLRGQIDLFSTEMMIPEYNVALTSVDGPLSFYYKKPLDLEDPSFSLSYLELEGALSGTYLLERERGEFTIDGALFSTMDLEVMIEGLSLEELSKRISIPYIEDLMGYSDVHVQLQGPLDSISLSGSIDLRRGRGDLLSYPLSLSRVEGSLSFSLQEPLSLEMDLSSIHLEDFSIHGSLKGLLAYGGEESMVSLRGNIEAGLYHLSLEGTSLPLSLLPVEERGVESLVGYGAGQLHLQGEGETFTLSGDVRLRDVGFSLPYDDLLFYGLLGQVTFSLQEPVKEMDLSSLELSDLDLKVSLLGRLLYEEERSTFTMRGDLHRGAMDLFLEGTSLPLSLLPVEEWGIESLVGYGTGEIHLQGDVEAFTLSGDVRLLEVGCHLPDYHLSLSQFEGDILFHIEEPLQDPFSIKVEDLSIETLLRGNVEYGGYGIPVEVTGLMEEMVMDLLLEGSSLPLSLLPVEEWGFKSLTGYSRGHIQLTGSPTSPTLSGELDLEDVEVHLPSQEVYLYGGKGDVTLYIEDLPSTLSSLDLLDLHLGGSLNGHLGYREEKGDFFLKGQLKEGQLDLSLLGENLPHHLLSSYDLVEVDSLTGVHRIDLHITGDLREEAFILSGDLELLEGELNLPSYGLSLSSLQGRLMFVDLLLEEEFSLSLEQFNVKGDIKGGLLFEEEKGFFSLIGQLEEGQLDLTLSGEDLPYHLFSAYDFVEIKNLTGLERLDLLLTGNLIEESFTLSLDLHFFKGAFSLPSYDISISSLQGPLTIHMKEPWVFNSPLPLLEMDIRGELAGLIHYEELETPFEVKGFLEKEHLSLFLTGEEVPLLALSSYLPSSWESLRGHLMVELDLSGELQDLMVKGKADFVEVGVYDSLNNLSLSSLRGPLSFEVSLPPLLEDLQEGLSLEKIDLTGELEGLLSYGGEETHVSLKGEIFKGEMELIGEASRISLDLIEREILGYDRVSVGGYGDLYIEVEGTLEAMALGGSVKFKDTSLCILEEELNLSSMEGHLFFHYPSLLSFDDPLASFQVEDLHLVGELKGLGEYRREDLSFTLAGLYERGEMDLQVELSKIALETIDRELLPPQARSLTGTGDLFLEVKGSLDSFTIGGELGLQDVSLDLLHGELLLSSIKGHLFFDHLSTLSIHDPLASLHIEDFHLSGELQGRGEYKREVLFFTLAGEILEEELEIRVASEDVPLHLLAEEIELNDWEVVMARGDVDLLLSGNLHHFYLSGEVEVMDSTISTPYPQLRASSLEGPMTFEVHRVLNSSLQLEGLSLEEVTLWMDLHGLLYQEEDVFSFHLGGTLERGYSHLLFHGQEIPLGAYAPYLPEGELHLLGGRGELLLYSKGPQEDFSIEGVLEVYDLLIDSPHYNLSFSQGEGEILIENQSLDLSTLSDSFSSSTFIFQMLALAHPEEEEPRPLELQGTVKEKDLFLSFTGENLPLAFLAEEGGTFLEGDVPLKVVEGGVDLMIEIYHAFSEPTFKGYGILRGATLYYEKENLLFEEVEGPLSFTTDHLVLEKLYGLLEGGELELKGEVHGWMELELDLTYSTLPLSLVEEYVEVFSDNGYSSGRLSILGDLEDPLVFGHVQLEEAYLLEYYLPSASLQLHYHKEKLMVMDVEASLLGGTLTGYGSLDLSGREPLYSASLWFKDLTLAPTSHIPEDLEGLLSGEVYLSGEGPDLERLQLIGSISLEEGSLLEYDFLDLSSDFWLYEGILHVSHMDLSIDDEYVEGYGTLDLEGRVNMEIVSQGRGHYIGEVLGEDLMARVRGHLSGSLTEPTFSGEVILSLGEKGSIALEMELCQETLTIKRGTLLALEEHLSLVGEYDFQKEDLQLSFDLLHFPLERIASLLPEDLPIPSRGETTGEMYVTGSINRPNIEGSLVFHDVDWEGQRLLDLSMEILHEEDHFFIKDSQLRFVGGHLHLYGDISRDLDLNLHLGGQNVSTETILSFTPPPPLFLEEIEGEVDFSLSLKGRTDQLEAEGSIIGETLYWRDFFFELTQGDFYYVDQVLHLPSLYLSREGDRASLEGSIDFKDSSLHLLAQLERVGSETVLQLLDLNTVESSFLFKGDLLLHGTMSDPVITCDLMMDARDERGEIQIMGDLLLKEEDLLLSFEAQDFPLQELTPFIGISYPLYGMLSLTGEITGTLSTPQLMTDDFSLREGRIGEYGIDAMDGEIFLKEEGLLTVTQSILIGGTHVQIQGDYGLTTEELDLYIIVEEGELDSISQFIPYVYEARGDFVLDLHLGGTLHRPLFSGKMDVDQGYFSSDEEEIFPITDLSGSLAFHHSFIHVEDLTGEYGEGPFHLYGEIGLTGLSIIYLSLSLTGEHLPLTYGNFMAHLYPSLSIEGSLLHPYIKGEVGLSQTIIHLPFEGPEGFGEEEDFYPLVDIYLYPIEDILVKDPRMEVYIEEGSLRLENFTGDYLLLGEIRSQQGSFQFLNNYFQLEEAKATFTRFYPNMPRIVGQVYTYLSAERRIFVYIDGLADDLSFTFEAENGMRQHEILAALAGTGDLKLMTGDFEDLTGDLWRFLVQSLRLDFIIQLEDALAATFDLDEVLIIQDMEENVQLRVGKFIIDDLYLTYRRTLSAQAKQEMGFEYRLNPYTMLGGTLYEDGEFRLMLKGSWPF